jgi:hypothetical protein
VNNTTAVDPSIISDCRYLADGKKRSLLFERYYTQVFDDKHGLIIQVVS